MLAKLFGEADDIGDLELMSLVPQMFKRMHRSDLRNA